jgi:ubiquinone/menaquinone biosynthesis C-methylase UbiE
MERLDTITAPANRDVEAAIHLARYAAALAYCPGRTVLDIACGEGYGSLLLRRFGAAQVEGVDMANEAIVKARHNCQTEGVGFHCWDGTKVDQLFPAESFDLIASIETLEHIADPELFLCNLRRLAKPGAIVVLTCPNDHCYYPDSGKGNPYHVRQYYFEEFQQLTTQVFGNDVRWCLGSPVLGFGSVPRTEGAEDGIGYSTLFPGSWLHYQQQQLSVIVPRTGPLSVNETNCSYFLGIWGAGGQASIASAAFPIDMYSYYRFFDDMSGHVATLQQQHALVSELQLALEKARSDHELALAEVNRLSSQLEKVDEEKRILEREARKYRLQAAVLMKEIDQLRANLPRMELESVKKRVNELQVQLQSIIRERDQLLTKWNSAMAVPRMIVPKSLRPILRRAVSRLISKD